jgi:hypothetical protein
MIENAVSLDCEWNSLFNDADNLATAYTKYI